MGFDLNNLIIDKIKHIDLYYIKCPDCGWNNSLDIMSHYCPKCGKDLLCGRLTEVNGATGIECLCGIDLSNT